jgi:predicted metal-dependent enzyme (double-stranded beta helix superfamily)
MTATTVVDAFIGDVKAVLAEDGPSERGLERIAERMKAFVREAGPQSNENITGNIHDRGLPGRNQAGPLYQDATGLTLVRARFGPETMTPIHSHGSWGVVGVYEGRDRYQVWRRVDPGTGAGEADVELVEERILEPGDAIVLPPPPQDIHAQQGMDGEAAYEYVLFGANTMILPRLYFDPEAQTAREVTPGQR